MSRKLFNNTLAALCTFALLFAVAMGVEAQTDDPLFEDDIVCSIQDGSELWVAPLQHKAALESQLGETATVEPFAALLDRMPQASNQATIRFEGGYPSGTAASELNALGYVTEVPVPATLRGCKSAVIRSV